MSQGRERLGNYSLGDLVEIGQGNVGCIVLVQMRDFRVLNTRGQVQTVSLQQMGLKKRSKYSVSFDTKGTQIAQGDVVRVVQGVHKGIQAIVKHVFRNWVFLYSKLCLSNGGIMVAPTKHVEMVGTVGKARNSAQGLNNGGNNNSAPSFRTNPQILRRQAQSDVLRNKKVKIISGVWKGFNGIVVGIAGDDIRVEINAANKTATVKRAIVIELTTLAEEKARRASQEQANPYSQFGRTPAHGIGGETPGYGMGGQTPHTPAGGEHGLGDYEDPWAARTPRHPSSEENELNNWYDQTPAPGASTYNSLETPMAPNDPFTPNPTTPYLANSEYNAEDNGYDAETNEGLQPSSAGVNDEVSNIRPGTWVVFNSREAVLLSIEGSQWTIQFSAGEIQTVEGPLEPVRVTASTEENTKVLILKGRFAGEFGLFQVQDTNDLTSVVSINDEMEILNNDFLAIFSQDF